MKIRYLPRKETYRLSKVRLGLLFGLILALIIVAVGHIINSPVVGTITRSGTSASQTANSVLGASESKQQYDGKYISFSYPSEYITVNTNLSGNYLEVYRIYSPRHTDRFIAVGVVRGSAANDSGVNLRQNRPEIYKPQPAPPGSLIFLNRQNGFERAVFIAHNDLVISILAVDVGGRDMTADQQQVIGSLKWK